jgi:hypothetical protein
MSLAKIFKQNAARTLGGAWMVIGTSADGSLMRLRVARAEGSNTAFKLAMERLAKPHQHALKGKKPNEAILTKIYQQALAETCILGWENLVDTDAHGEEHVITYSTAAALALLETYPELYSAVSEFASDSTNYVGDFDEEEALKN